MRKQLCVLLLLAFATANLHAQGLLEGIANELDQYPGRGVVWEMTYKNELPPNWIIPTTDKVDGAVLARAVGQMVSRAQRTVDITVLTPMPHGVFLEELKKGLATLASSGRAVTVRILAGNPNFVTPENTRAFLAELAPTVHGSNVTIFVAGMTTCNPPACAGAVGVVSSFNHAKIVAVDGQEAIVGGHNMWSDYTGHGPIYDLSMQVKGPAARAAANFTTGLWKFTCSTNRHGVPLWLTYSSAKLPGHPPIQDVCSFFEPQPLAEGTGKLPILAMGRYGAGTMNLGELQPQWQWSDIAMQRVLESAQSTMRISQQDLMTTTGAVNEPIVGAIVALLARPNPGHAYLIVTNFAARGRSLLSPYSWFVHPKALGIAIKQRVARRMRLPEDHPDVRNRVCNNLHLGGLARFDPNGQPTQTWPDARPMGNHAKFYMVDDRVFYIGSHNMYPITATSVEPREWWRVLQGSLQEYCYIIDDAGAAKQLMEQYWTPIWEPTRMLAVSGGLPSCQL